jgi:hypothetical protein
MTYYLFENLSYFYAKIRAGIVFATNENRLWYTQGIQMLAKDKLEEYRHQLIESHRTSRIYVAMDDILETYQEAWASDICHGIIPDLPKQNFYQRITCWWKNFNYENDRLNSISRYGLRKFRV